MQIETKGLSKFVASRMKAVRVALYLNQEEVAKDLEITQSFYSMMEGRRSYKISVDIIEKFCNAYKVNPQWLFGNDVPVFISDDLENTIGRKLKKKEKPLTRET